MGETLLVRARIHNRRGAGEGEGAAKWGRHCWSGLGSTTDEGQVRGRGQQSGAMEGLGAVHARGVEGRR